MKNKSQNYCLEEIFGPVNNKSLRLRSEALEMQLSRGVWGSPFKRLPTACAKKVYSLLKEIIQCK